MVRGTSTIFQSCERLQKLSRAPLPQAAAVTEAGRKSWRLSFGACAKSWVSRNSFFMRRSVECVACALLGIDLPILGTSPWHILCTLPGGGQQRSRSAHLRIWILSPHQHLTRSGNGSQLCGPLRLPNPSLLTLNLQYQILVDQRWVNGVVSGCQVLSPPA